MQEGCWCGDDMTFFPCAELYSLNNPSQIHILHLQFILTRPQGIREQHGQHNQFLLKSCVPNTIFHAAVVLPRIIERANEGNIASRTSTGWESKPPCKDKNPHTGFESPSIRGRILLGTERDHSSDNPANLGYIRGSVQSSACFLAPKFGGTTHPCQAASDWTRANRSNQPESTFRPLLCEQWHNAQKESTQRSLPSSLNAATTRSLREELSGAGAPTAPQLKLMDEFALKQCGGKQRG